MRTHRPIPFAAATLLGAALLLPPPPAAALGASLSEKARVDDAVGYSIRPISGWEALPRKNPDDPTAQCQVGGWYGKGKGPKGKDDYDAEVAIYAFGSFFPEESRAVATEVSAPAEPEKPGGPEPGGPGEGGPADPGTGGGDPGDGGTGGGDPGGGDPGDEDPGKREVRPEEKKKPTSLKDLFGEAPDSWEAWLKQRSEILGRNGWRVDLKPVKAKFGDDEGFLWEGTMRPPSGTVYQCFAASVRRGGFEVAAWYRVMDHKNFVRDYKGAFVGSLKSLRILTQRQMDRARDALAKKLAEAGGDDGAWAERVIDGLPPGWTFRRTDHYVIVYDKSIDASPPKGVPGLIPRIGRQLEALRRDIYEPLFPADREVTATSIVKVTQDPKQYLSYGAPEGSAGYWSWPSRELVFFCKSDDYELTLSVLNHEAFHQYIFYAVGQVAPHSWFNEGHGDYFAGFDLKEGKFRPGKFDWRRKKIEKALRGRTHVPLDKFLKFSQAEYYRRGGNASEGGDIGQNYAQGWSLVWFLRTTKEPKYQGILDRYFNTLKAAVTKWRTEEEALAAKENRKPLPTFLFPNELNEKAREDALQAGFGGIDLPQLERDWIASEPW